jgi:hypothetical protein
MPVTKGHQWIIQELKPNGRNKKAGGLFFFNQLKQNIK